MNEIKNILVPLDFSEHSDRIFQAACVTAEKFGADLHLVFVVEDFSPYAWLSVPHFSFNVMGEEIAKGAERKIETYIEKNLPSTVSCDGKVLHGDAAEEIVKLARDTSTDLIVMGTHGFQGLEKVLLGSVAERVLKSAPCPVLVVNARY